MNQFKCPHCNRTQPFFKTFRIKPFVETACSHCKEKIQPKFNKKIESTWNYTFLLGVFIGTMLPLSLLNQGYGIVTALLSGLLLGIVVIFVYVFIIYRTTKFEK